MVVVRTGIDKRLISSGMHDIAFFPGPIHVLLQTDWIGHPHPQQGSQINRGNQANKDSGIFIELHCNLPSSIIKALGLYPDVAVTVQDRI